MSLYDARYCFWKRIYGFCGRYIIVSLLSLDFSFGDMRRPSGALSSTKSRDVGWKMNKNV